MHVPHMAAAALPDRYSYGDCVKYAQIMKHHVARMIKEGINGEGEFHQGYPRKGYNERVPAGDDAIYELFPGRNSRPRATKTHGSLPYLRQHAFNAAITRMKNACIYPVKMKGKTLWNNFPRYIYTFHVHYCDLEGLTRTHELSRKVLLYLFYGKYQSKGKTFNIIRCLHYKTIQGRHRFGKYVKKHFHTFIASLEQNPEWTTFFDDLGKGDAPIDYLAQVEMGLREFGGDIHAMGSNAMLSKERWFAVEVWRKREAYIALIRHIREHNSYPQWDCYTLEDFAERQALNKTFLARHLPLTNGTDNRLQEHVPDPLHWSAPPAPPAEAPRPKKRSKKGGLKPYAKELIAAATAKPMVWDVDNNCFVPFE